MRSWIYLRWMWALALGTAPTCYNLFRCFIIVWHFICCCSFAAAWVKLPSWHESIPDRQTDRHENQKFHLLEFITKNHPVKIKAFYVGIYFQCQNSCFFHVPSRLLVTVWLWNALFLMFDKGYEPWGESKNSGICPTVMETKPSRYFQTGNSCFDILDFSSYHSQPKPRLIKSMVWCLVR